MVSPVKEYEETLCYSGRMNVVVVDTTKAIGLKDFFVSETLESLLRDNSPPKEECWHYLGDYHLVGQQRGNETYWIVSFQCPSQSNVSEFRDIVKKSHSAHVVRNRLNQFVSTYNLYKRALEVEPGCLLQGTCHYRLAIPVIGIFLFGTFIILWIHLFPFLQRT